MITHSSHAQPGVERMIPSGWVYVRLQMDCVSQMKVVSFLGDGASWAAVTVPPFPWKGQSTVCLQNI